MSLSPLHRYLVQRSFTTLATHIETTTLFNRRLLDLNPTRSWLFGDDTIAQPERLLHLLALAVAFIDQPALLTVWTVETWKRYQHYGITETDLQLVSEALLWVIEHELGETFTVEVGRAWARFYALLAECVAIKAR